MDPLARGGHRQLVPAGAGHRAPGPGRERPRLRHPCAQLGLARRQRVGALGRPQALEPPAALGVQAQQVVVERKLEVRQRAGPRRRGVQLLHPRAEPVAQPPHPAAVYARALDGVELEQSERVLAGIGHPHRLRPHQRAAACPGPGQRERPLVAAHEQRRALGRESPVQAGAPRFHADSVAAWPR